MSKHCRAICARGYKGVLLLIFVGFFVWHGGFGGRLPVVHAQGETPVEPEAAPIRVFMPVLANGGDFSKGTGSTNATQDLVITRVEVTQAVQTLDNSVPLVAGRATMVRVFTQVVDTSGTAKSLPNITVALGKSGTGAMVEAEPILVTAEIQPQSAAEIYASTINVPLPVDWASGSFDLNVTLDPNNALAETNEANNSLGVHLNFLQVPALRVKIVPIIYTHSDGVTYPAPSLDSISDYIKRIYPVSNLEITWHKPFAFQGNMKEVNSFSSLLSQINAMKKSEGAPASQVYYALVPTNNGMSSWFNGGYVGLGYIGNRVAVGLDYSGGGQTAAHEIGHTMGRYHAPCGSPSSPDASYPYADAKIGQFGLDVFNGTLYLPEVGKDVMSYCAPKWVSDYTYKALLSAQLAQGADIATANFVAERVERQPVLAVRALVGEGGTEMLPAYVMNARPDAVPQDSALQGNYRLQWIGAQGEVVDEVAVAALEVAMEDETLLDEVQAYVALPTQAVSGLRLLKGDTVLAEQALQLGQAQAFMANAAPDMANSLPANVETASDGVTLRWQDDGTPVMVQASTDGGQTWQIVAMDVTGGTLRVDAAPGSMFDVIPAK